MEGNTTLRNGILGTLLERIVDDIFDSSCSDSSFVDDDFSDGIVESSVPSDYQEVLESEAPRTRTKKRKKGKKRTRYLFTLPSYEPDEFRQRFMVSQETFDFLLELIGQHLTVGLCRSNEMPPQLQLLIALRKMCSSDSYRTICEEFGVGKTSSLRAVTRVIQALFSCSSKYIVWPKGKRIQEACRSFQTISGVPKVIGSLDCTYISIPDQSPDVAVHCVPLQAVVDHEGRFVHCAIGTTGLRKKQEMLNISAVHDYISDSGNAFPDDCHLVAGPEYDLHERVMVPFSGVDLTEEQEHFNDRLQVARTPVTQAFAVLKGRFAGVRHKLDMFRKDLIPIFIMACCVLHNICLDRKDFYTGEIILPVTKRSSKIACSEVVPTACALEKRDSLCRQMYLSKAEGFVFV